MRRLSSLAAALVLSGAACGSATATATPGLACAPSVDHTADHVSSVCRGHSGNEYTEVRAVADCRDLGGGDEYSAFGPWVPGGTDTSRAYCDAGDPVFDGSLELR
ncbi:hypothetical protein [Allonocardiopsis opalescens]|uniref:Secreted protein n=1 Tax=Allonocardiopsis opalescens TaxID=1144618 RepID=A0A2T0Q2L7_9ACTN|nr:hypothetical protein [Allonocardiopsis opalescens]PRX98029.1 hypothetical protein CLV72_105382 [Allonocardiopsis opalescens]